MAFSFVFGIFRTGENSMEPAIQDGDLVIYYRLDKDFVASEVAVVKYQDQLLTGRVIAVAGDTVDITDDGLMINGARQHEQKITSKTSRYQDGIEFPVTLKDGQVFLLGDNRTEATDSRIYGPVNIKDIYGKVMTVIRRRNI